MKILFVVPSYKPAYIYGGPIVVIAQLAERLAFLGHAIFVYTTTANGEKELDVPLGKEMLVDGVNVVYFKRITKDHTHASPALWKKLNQTVKFFDIVHLHSWWNLLTMGAAFICKLNNIKPILSPHGMFSNYILDTNNSAKKKWMHRLGGKALLQNSWLHVSTEMEWQESIKIIPEWRGEIIPNLVQLSGKKYSRINHEDIVIGFLSRVDPKKGLDILIRALSKVNFPYKLQVAGSGEESYINTLKNLSREVGNYDKIEWLGWKSGEDKFKFLSEIDLFALTSHSENFAIVVIESLSVGTPVLVSENVGLCNYVSQNNYGWVTGMDIEEIGHTLTNIFNNKLERLRITEQVPALIKEEYNDTRLTKEYLKFYEKVIED